jgi:hypothetical protein
MSLAADNILKEYDYLRDQTVITGIKLNSVGENIAGANKHMFGFKFPVSQIGGAEGGAEGNLLTVNGNYIALKDVISEGLVTSHIQNGQATLT